MNAKANAVPNPAPNPAPNPPMSVPTMTNLVEPFVYQALQSFVNKHIVVETPVKGSVRGKLLQVLPDHIVLESYGVPFYIRTQQIVWVTPATAG